MGDLSMNRRVKIPSDDNSSEKSKLLNLFGQNSVLFIVPGMTKNVIRLYCLTKKGNVVQSESEFLNWKWVKVAQISR